MQCFHKQWVPILTRMLRGILLFPSFQQTQVIAQHPKAFLLCLPVSHFLADFSFDYSLLWRIVAFAVKAD